MKRSLWIIQAKKHIKGLSVEALLSKGYKVLIRVDTVLCYCNTNIAFEIPKDTYFIKIGKTTFVAL